MSEHGPRTISVEQLRIPAASGWGRLPWVALAVAAIAIAVSALLGSRNPKQLYYSWLVAFLFFLSIALGALFFVLVHHATKSGWGVAVRRLAEKTAATLPFFVLLFVPIVFGLHELYHWTHADAVAHDHLLQGKQPYLNTTFFSIRAAVFFVLWSLIALWYAAASRRQDSSGDERLSRRMILFSGPAIAIFALTVTFAAFDWIMSLDPHWYSTIFGVYYFAGCLVATFAFLIIMAAALARAGYLNGVVTVEHFHDLGKLLFAFTVFWTYIAFAQFMLIWYANIPEETVWFLHRQQGSWMQASMLLGWGHFALPFLFLMPRTIKRKLPFLVAGASWMLLIHLVDLYWLVMPNLHPHGIAVSLLDVSTLVAVGALFLAAVSWLLARDALVPLRDPRLLESLSFENF